MADNELRERLLTLKLCDGVHIKVLFPLQCGQQRVHEKWRLPANEATGSAGCCQHCLPLQNTQQSRKQRGPHHYGKVSRSLFIKQLCG